MPVSQLLIRKLAGKEVLTWIRRIEVSDQPFMTREETSGPSSLSQPIRYQLKKGELKSWELPGAAEVRFNKHIPISDTAGNGMVTPQVICNLPLANC